MFPVCDMNCEVILCRRLIVEWFRCFNESTATNRSFNITTDVPSELDGNCSCICMILQGLKIFHTLFHLVKGGY